MDAIRANAFPFVLRALLFLAGALLLWEAPTSIVGLVVMLIGLVCAITGLTLDVSVVR